MEWADALVWRSVLGGAGDDHPVLERLHHFHATQWAYLQVLEGRPIDVPELAAFPDSRSLGRWARRFYADLPACRDALDEDRLSRHVDFPWAAQLAKRFGSPGPATVGESILQLALHSTYHRAQVATRLRERGAEPPLTDFIAWIWTRRPAPDWACLDD
jgi:uncharacterized damage-inducible protein DinB